MFIKLIILPLYIVLPFSLTWFDSRTYWYIPFVLWLIGIVVNALVERSRGEY
ncbi:hypothetical protein [Reinekea marinisedimentorum]|uniref:hypothetical protein n=1 Tax=Reinekea marinisedimentorum TaxID=230495 RepID=UPI00140483BF|nr:hypothetical protein [Reinekea marinisedimentorum]